MWFGILLHLAESMCESLDSSPTVWNTFSMRQRNRYRNYISLEVLVVLIVLGSFKFIPSKEIAATVAGLAFFVSTSLIIWLEVKKTGFKKRPTFWAASLFMVASVLPIGILRLMDQPVDVFHKAANYLFLLLLVALFVDSYTENRKALENQQP